MSRYNIPTKEPEKFECIVGYDPPFDTLFAQVIDFDERRREEECASRIAQAQDAELDLEEMNEEADEEREPFVLWVGTSTREITDVEILRRTALLNPTPNSHLRCGKGCCGIKGGSLIRRRPFSSKCAISSSASPKMLRSGDATTARSSRFFVMRNSPNLLPARSSRLSFNDYRITSGIRAENDGMHTPSLTRRFFQRLHQSGGGERD